MKTFLLFLICTFFASDVSRERRELAARAAEERIMQQRMELRCKSIQTESTETREAFVQFQTESTEIATQTEVMQSTNPEAKSTQTQITDLRSQETQTHHSGTDVSTQTNESNSEAAEFLEYFFGHLDCAHRSYLFWKDIFEVIFLSGACLPLFFIHGGLWKSVAVILARLLLLPMYVTHVILIVVYNHIPSLEYLENLSNFPIGSYFESNQEISKIRQVIVLFTRSIRAYWFLKPLLSKFESEDLPALTQTAVRSLGGYYPKFAQSLALRDDIITCEHVRHALRSCLEDNDAHISNEKLLKRIQQEAPFGTQKIQIDEWRKAGTISQANLISVDGKNILVKTIHDGVKVKFIADHFVITWILEYLLKTPNNAIASAHSIRLKIMQSILPPLFQELLKEFDFHQEFENMKHAEIAIKEFETFQHLKLSIPEPICVSKTGSMLFQSFEKGKSLNTILKSTPEEAKLFSTAVIHFFGVMLFQGWFHGDLHPGNIIVDSDAGRLVFIDWGSRICLGSADKTEKILMLISHVCHQTQDGNGSNDFEMIRKVLDPNFVGTNKLRDYLRHFGREMKSLGLHLEDIDNQPKSDIIHGVFALLLTFDLQTKNGAGKCEFFDDIMKSISLIRNPDWFVALQKQYSFFVGMMNEAGSVGRAKDLWDNDACLGKTKEKRRKEAENIVSCSIL